jgi:hypothetical protein
MEINLSACRKIFLTGQSPQNRAAMRVKYNPEAVSESAGGFSSIWRVFVVRTEINLEGVSGREGASLPPSPLLFLWIINGEGGGGLRGEWAGETLRYIFKGGLS